MPQAVGLGSPFRILVVDDDRTWARVLREVMGMLTRPYELHFVGDGVEALDFLHRSGSYADAPRPSLILLDLNMPRLGGLETLSAIKNDPELYVIPVIMLSSSISPHDVRTSYQARANCYVQKPIDLQRSVKLLQAIETFWIDFALLPAGDERQFLDFKRETTPRLGEIRSGPPIARATGEARSHAMRDNDAPEKIIATPSTKSGCTEHNRLLDAFGAAVRDLLALLEQQFLAIVDGDNECSRFDLLIHMANERKQAAKYAYLRHMEAHGCSNH
jgi:chemotaxis family two-component system response regulator Rcp1